MHNATPEDVLSLVYQLSHHLDQIRNVRCLCYVESFSFWLSFLLRLIYRALPAAPSTILSEFLTLSGSRFRIGVLSSLLLDTGAFIQKSETEFTLGESKLTRD